MSKISMRVISVLICMIMVITAIPAEAFAATDNADETHKPTAISNADGETEVSEAWEKAYPYGVFAFGDYGTAITEGGDPLTIPVYRLGGTKGRVTAYVIYNPAVTQLDENNPGYASALSTDDIEFEVQDASPIAQYQPIGKDPDPEAGNFTVKSTSANSGYTLTLSNDADAYQWQVKSEQIWQDAYNETDKSLTVTNDEYKIFDFRCVYKKDNSSYCTASVKGEKYVKPDPEVLPDMPEDLDLGPALTYTKLEPDENDAYKGYAFELTFADGEWRKNIVITPLEDDISECNESAALIIQECDGGCINKSFNSMSVTVEDNDPAEPFELGFTETEIKADKADGSVKLVVRRTGGYQEPVTIQYETVDGTAKAGKDYVAASDTMAFAGDVKEITLELPLLDDGVKTNNPKEFTVRLKNLQGDYDDICTLTETEVTISLINSGKATKTNLATKLTDKDAIELASSDDPNADGVVDTTPDTVTGTQVAEPEPVRGEIKKGSSVKGMLKSYQYPDTIKFSKTTGDDGCWTDTYSPLLSGQKFSIGDGMSYTEGQDSIHLYTYTQGNNCNLTIDHMAQKFTDLYFTLYQHGVEDSSQSYWPVHLIPGVEFGNSSYFEYQGDQHYHVTGTDDPNDTLTARINADALNTFPEAAYIDISNIRVTRRAFGKPLNLKIYTANDSDTAPRQNNALSSDSDMYEAFTPTISIYSGQGGSATDDGNLYVGSTIQIDLSETAAYYPLTSGTDVDVFLTDPDGNKVAKAVTGKDAYNNDIYTLTLLWDGMNSAGYADVIANGSFSLNVVMSRKQDLSLDLTPSVKRADDGETPDLSPENLSDAINAFWDRSDDPDHPENNYFEYGYSCPNDEGSFSSDDEKTVRINKDDVEFDDQAVFSPDVPDNIQWINFHRNEKDYILLNGTTYAGNETIYLNGKDLNIKNLACFYYSEEYATVASKMVAKVDHLELFRDTNHNNKIDGTFNSNTLHFTLDEDSGDQLLMRIDDDDTFTESDLSYIKNKDGSMSQLYFKVYYSMNPRKLIPSDDEEASERAQVMPALVTDITDPAQYFDLTEEQKNYRYLISGQYSDDKHKNADGTYMYTSDGHLMYGGEASLLQYVDAPLGGDQSPPTSSVNENGDTIYSWTPKYVGNLLYPYDDPATIYIENTVAGDNYAIDDTDNLNGYLGSLVESTKMALCVAKQNKSVGDILKGDDPDEEPENGAKGKPKDHHDFSGGDSSSPFGPVPMPDPTSWADGVTGDAYDYNQKTSLTAGVDLDLRTGVPTMSIGVCGVVNVTIDGRDVILSINVPFGSLYVDKTDNTASLPGGDISSIGSDTSSSSGSDSGSGSGSYSGSDSGSGSGSYSDSGSSNDLGSGSGSGDDQSEISDIENPAEPDNGIGYSNSAATQFKAFAGLFTKEGGARLANALKDRGASYLASSSSPKAGFWGFNAYASMAFVFSFKYDAVQHKKVYQEFTWGVSIGVQGSITWRPLGIFYICITGGLSATLATGKHKAFYYVYGDLYSNAKPDDGVNVKAGEHLVNTTTNKESFAVKYRQISITFKGKVNLELFEDEACTTPVKNANKGYLESDSMQLMEVPLTHGTDFGFSGGSTYYLQITAINDSQVNLIETIEKRDSKWLNEELNLNITPFINIAGGVGFGCLKAEISFNAFFSMNFVAKETLDNDEKYLDTGDLGFTVSISFQLLCVSYSCSLVSYSATYDLHTGKWMKNNNKTVGVKPKDDQNSIGAKRGAAADYGYLFSLPEDTSDTQTIYQTQKDSSGGGLKAYKPTDDSVPFELSGYYSSSNAARLLDGVHYGYDYRVIPAKKTVDGKLTGVNYVIYHISRASDDTDSTLDQSMLVMSELVMTGNKNGLVNPFDPESKTPYIVVDVTNDLDSNGYRIPDNTGDHDFSVDTVDVTDKQGNITGSNIRVAWISYDEPADANTNMSTQTFTEIAQNTVLKTANYTTGEQNFTAFRTINNAGDTNAAGAKGEYVQNPDISSYGELTEGSEQNEPAEPAQVTESTQSTETTEPAEPAQTDDSVSDAVTYARANNMTVDEINERTADYESYLSNCGYCISNPTTDDEIVSQNNAQALITKKTALWATSGKSSDLCVKIGNSPVSSVAMEDGVTIDSVKMQEIGGKYYVAYTTTEDSYTDKQGNVITDPSAAENILTLKRLYLRTCSLDGSGKVVWGMDGKSILIRTLYEYDNGMDDSQLQDGIYINGQITPKDHPYFDNLQFLSANLGDSLGDNIDPETLPLRKGGDSSEDFLLFDMCGSTYIIRQSSLETMTGSAITDGDSGTTTTAKIIPFFTPDIANTSDNGATASSGRVDTTIGVDGDGNLAAVYTTGVPNTNNTALCICKYDPNAACWGEKTLLAMNYLSVYEDNLKNHRSDSDSAQSFFGLLKDDEDNNGKDDEETAQGGLNEFKFTNPQIALGKESVTDENGKAVSKPTLMILTQGSMQYLKENTDPDTMSVSPIIPVDADEVRENPNDYERSKDVPPGTGIYAVEFGSGTQAIGNISLSMPIEDYSNGAKTDIVAGFENTGDVPIRGSKDQPITIEALTTLKGATALATWHIYENVVPGQKVSVSGKLDIKETLPVGSKVYLKVSEDPYYEDQGGTPFVAHSDDLLEIKAHPELAVRNYKDDCIALFDSVDDDGDALIDISFAADNRGTEDAKNVYAVFSYDTGAVDDDGNAIYEALDLTHSDIKIKNISIDDENALGDPKKGIVEIGNIDVNKAKQISGTMKVSPDCFKEKDTNSLALKIELFSDADKSLPEDSPAGSHNEYNSTNNIYTGPVSHQTVFTAPVNIEIPSGEELHLPVKCTYTTGEEVPHILVTEFPDLNGDTHFGAHAFRYGEFGSGAGSGALELKANIEGSGYIRIKDINTNSFFDIAYKVTSPASGINVYYDDDSIFTFYNVDNSEFNKDLSDQTWEFPDNVTAWGKDESQPYEKNLSMGAVGSSFTFETDAESIDLVFRGQIQVECDDITPVIVSASGGSGDEDGETATVVLGSNPKGKWRTVKITVLDGDEVISHPYKYASFDRIIQHYDQSGLPVPDDDETAPQIFFGQSFPESGSIASKTADGKKNTVEINTFVFDETGVATVSVNGKVAEITNKEDVRFWTASLKFSKNGIYTITTIDDLGNMTDYKLSVDWFSDTAENETYSLPTVEATLMKRGTDGNDDVELTDDVDFTEDDTAYITATGKASVGEVTPGFSATEVTITEKDGLISFPTASADDGTFPACSSGWYIIKAVDPAANGDCWTATVVEMLHLNQKQLIITVDEQAKFHDQPDPEFTYTAVGLWQGDALTGSLTREEGENVGTYAIQIGTLSAGDDYHVIYNGADLTISHDYVGPSWRWETYNPTRALRDGGPDANITIAHASFTCSICGDTQTFTDNSPATVHIDASCTEGPYDCYESKVTFNDKDYTDHYNKRYTGDPLGHDFVEDSVVAPTCGENGYTLYICTRCGATDKRDIIPHLDHTYKEEPTWEWITDAVHIDSSYFPKSLDIYPDHYTVDDVNPVDKDSSETVFWFDTPDRDHQLSVNIHNEDDSPVTFNLACKNCTIVNDQHFTVYGDNVTINLLLDSSNSWNKGQFFVNDDENAFTTLNIAKSGDQTITFSDMSGFTSGNFTVNKIGEYDIVVGSDTVNSFSDIEGNNFSLVGGSDTFDTTTAGAYATFTCSVCGKKHLAKDDDPVYGDFPATCTQGGFTGYEATVTCYGTDYIGRKIIESTSLPTDHNYGDPVWEWYDTWNAVEIDMQEHPKLDIHPNYYTLDDGDTVTQRSAYTKYILTNHSNTAEVTVHDGETDPATYNICLSDLEADKSIQGDFLTVGGQNATVDISLRGDNTVKCNMGYIFNAASSDADATINIAKEDSGTTSFNTGINPIASQGITFNKVGDYAGDVDTIQTDKDMDITGDAEYPEAYDCPVETLAVFTCSTCHHVEIVKADVENEVRDGKHYGVATATLGDTYTDEKMTDHITGYTLGLSGSIEVSFYLDLTDLQISDGSTVDFKWNVNGKDKTASVTLTKDDNTVHGYKATCPIAVAEMTYDINATLTVGGKKVETDKYSAAQYADVILTDYTFASEFVEAENQSGKDGEQKLTQLKELVKSMLDYGAKAQIYFDRNKDKLANAKLTADDDTSPYYYNPEAVTADMINTGASDMSEGLADYGLKYEGSTIVYLSQTSMRHYYSISDVMKFAQFIEHHNSFTFNGEPVEYIVKGDKLYFQLKNITSTNLDTLYPLVIGDHEYDYSVLDYVKACLNSNKVSSETKDLAAATYLYSQAANAYFEKQAQ